MKRKWLGAVVLPLAVAATGYGAEKAGVSDRATLETVCELVARNEALTNPIRMNYTVKLSRTGEPQEPAGGARRPGRRYSHSNCVWAQNGDKHYARVEYFYGPNEPANSSVYVFDTQILTEGRRPDLTMGTIRLRDTHDWYNVQVTKLGLRPFEGDHMLSRILVPEHASIHDKIEIIDDCETYVVDAKRPTIYPYFARIWIDRHRGMPLRIWYFGKHPSWYDARLMSEINNIKLHQLPNGAWIPVEGVRSVIFSDYIAYEHISVDVNSISVQRQDIPDSLFRIDFPDGARIFNAMSGLTTVQGKPQKSYEQIVRSENKFIAGSVSDQNGAPVPDVVVRVDYLKTPRSEGRFDIRNLSSQDCPCVTTDAQGRFAIELEKDGVYDLRFLPKNHADTIAYDVPVGKKDLKVAIEQGGTVTGWVVRIENGREVPFVNVEVKAEQDTYNIFAHLGFDRNRKTRTDSQGRFRFEHLQTRMRRYKGGAKEQAEYVPRAWKVSCAQASRSITFDDAKMTEEVQFVLEPAVNEMLPLIGKRLPKFDGIRTGLSAEGLKDKVLLVCFFDMNQRPSRNCIIQLAKQAEQLRQKGVTVIAVEASKADEKMLNEWVKENSIPFSVGMIEGEAGKTCFAWGVKSLPWLILTDTEHMVWAEGFGLDELDKRVRENRHVRE
jgi:hypothetical protein